MFALPFCSSGLLYIRLLLRGASDICILAMRIHDGMDSAFWRDQARIEALHRTLYNLAQHVIKLKTDFAHTGLHFALKTDL